MHYVRVVEEASCHHIAKYSIVVGMPENLLEGETRDKDL